jgi:hypothetical protein
MDPITTAILAAAVAGAVSGTSNVAERAIGEAYDALKGLIKSKFGADSKLARAVQDVEDDPQSKGAPIVLEEQVAKAKASEDPELARLAQTLLDAVKAQPGGAQIVQQATGSHIAQAAGGSTATVNVNTPPSKS